MQILNDTLDLAKVEAGRLTLESAPFDLADLMTETAELFASLAHEKGIELIVAPAPDLDCLVVGDALRLRQVLLNLIGNALKFTKTGEIVLIADLSVRSLERPIVSITVRDSGIGMSSEVLARIFDPFTQGDESTTRRFGGTGLGLTICREFAELMGGTIRTHSEPDIGSAFTVRLPLAFAPSASLGHPLAGRSMIVVTRRDALANAVERQCRLLGALCREVNPDTSDGSLAGVEALLQSGLRALRALGCRIAIDDFGTGYSSLAYLKGLAVDELKLDQSFIRNVDSDHADAAICIAVLSLARDLGLSVTAEGIESASQLQWFRDHGCNDAQGFFLARPMPAHEILRRYAVGQRTRARRGV